MLEGVASHGTVMVPPANEHELDRQIEYSEKSNDEQEHKIQPIWTMVIIFICLHIGSIYGLYLIFTSAKLATILFTLFMYQFNGWGITAGAHRLWSHRSYNAKWPLRLLLLIMFTSAYQHSVIKWARNHRIHHKYGDTNADPHNPKRGFFFAQIGWVVCKPHPDVIKKGKLIDMSDLYNDPLVKFQHEHIGTMSLLLCYILPTIIPMYFWNETLNNAFYIVAALRWTVVVHVTGFVNSIAHFYGNKPYDKHSSSVQTLTTSILTGGEGWHNYHHAFPWDYKTSELGQYLTNTTTGFIDFFAWLGWASDMKTVSPELIQQRVRRTGDGTHETWGWIDKDLTYEDRIVAKTLMSSQG